MLWLELDCLLSVGRPPFTAHSPAHGHGGMQYFISVFTTKCLHGLDGIHYELGKSNRRLLGTINLNWE